jgi:hypothetical protein
VRLKWHVVGYYGGWIPEENHQPAEVTVKLYTLPRSVINSQTWVVIGIDYI